MTLTVKLPWPPKEVFPNYKRSHHWRAVYKHEKAYRTSCAWEAKLALSGAKIGLSGEIKIKVSFYPPDRRKRDDDGIIGAFKNGRDGLADALGVDDNRFRASYEFGEPTKGGAVVVTVKEEREDED